MACSPNPRWAVGNRNPFFSHQADDLGARTCRGSTSVRARPGCATGAALPAGNPSGFSPDNGAVLHKTVSPPFAPPMLHVLARAWVEIACSGAASHEVAHPAVGCWDATDHQKADACPCKQELKKWEFRPCWGHVLLALIPSVVGIPAFSTLVQSAPVHSLMGLTGAAAPVRIACHSQGQEAFQTN